MMDKINFDSAAIQQNEMSRIRGGVSRTINISMAVQEHVVVEHEWYGSPQPGQEPDEIIVFNG